MWNDDLLPIGRASNPKPIGIEVELSSRLSVLQIQAAHCLPYARAVSPGSSFGKRIQVDDGLAPKAVNSRGPCRELGHGLHLVRSTYAMKSTKRCRKDRSVLQIEPRAIVVWRHTMPSEPDQAEVLPIDPEEASVLTLVEEPSAPAVVPSELGDLGHFFDILRWPILRPDPDYTGSSSPQPPAPMALSTGARFSATETSKKRAGR